MISRAFWKLWPDGATRRDETLGQATPLPTDTSSGMSQSYHRNVKLLLRWALISEKEGQSTSEYSNDEQTFLAFRSVAVHFS
jgi:hypothetical protein